MATIILPAIFAPITGGASITTTMLTQQAIWAAVGSYIDNAFIFPALFSNTTTGPKLDDQDVSSAKEGAPKNFCIGPECRTDGQVIWMTDLREIKDTDNSGGKGGQSGSYVTYKYYCDVAIAICENQINQVKKIWADGKLLYNVEPDITINMNTCTGTISQGVPSYTPPITYYFLTITAPAGGVDLSRFVSGKQVVASGFIIADAANNGTHSCFASGTNVDGTTYVKFRRSTVAFAAFAASENPNATLFQDAPSFSTKQVHDIIFYYGTETQEPDPIIEAYEGDGLVPGFRGVAYVVLENLALLDFGNRVPNITFLVEADEEITLGDAIARILERAEVDSGLYDVDAIQDQNLRGITLSGTNAPVSDIQPIMIAYNIAAQLRDGVLTFVYREDLPVFAIDVAHMAARFSDEAGGVPFQISDKIDYELNSNVSVEYMDPEKDYQTGTQLYVPANPLKPNPNTMTFPITFSANEARALAERLFWLQWVSRQEVSFTLPPSYIYLREGDNVTFTYSGSSYQVLIQRIDRGQESQFLVISGTIEDQSIYTRTVDGQIANSTLGSFDGARNYGYPGALEWGILDIPALQEEHLSRPGFYAYATNAKNAMPFGGATLFESCDSGLSYQKVDVIYFQANSGVANNSALNTTVSPLYWDDISSLIVVMTNGTLSSITDQQCLNGGNRAAIGNEIIGFVNAELTDVNTYTLTRFLRGLRGTEDRISSHVVNEIFVHLNGPGVIWHDLNLSAVGHTRMYKLAPNGGALELEEPTTITLSAATLKGFAPVNVVMAKDGSNNVVVSFTPRSRALFVDFMPQAIPFLEERDVHEIKLYTSGGVYKRTKLSADGVHAIGYSAEEQTADGITPGTSFRVDISRKSSRIYNNPLVTKTATPTLL